MVVFWASTLAHLTILAICQLGGLENVLAMMAFLMSW